MKDETLTENEKAVNLKFALYMGATDAGDPFPPNTVLTIPELGSFPVHGMKYVRSWDWLLPVWDKAFIEIIDLQTSYDLNPIEKEVIILQELKFASHLKKVYFNDCVMILQDIIDTIKKHNDNIKPHEIPGANDSK